MTLLANSEAAVWTAMLGGKLRSKPRCLIGFWASSGLIVDFANSVIIRTPIYGIILLRRDCSYQIFSQ
jgi:hypothetical protein